MAVIAMIAAAASAHAGSGGLGSGGTPECPSGEFGSRTLARGDCGGDVRTLNWILSSFELGVRDEFGPHFRELTERSVKAFQSRADLPRDGVVGDSTRAELVSRMNRDEASWYGPGSWGSKTACGVRLKRRTVGVAHRRLPCGTRVTFAYEGRFLRTRVIDRGPYVKDRKWDLTGAARERLGFSGVDEVRAAIVR